MKLMGQRPAAQPKTVDTATTETVSVVVRLLAEPKAVSACPKPATGDSGRGEGVAGTTARETLAEMTAAAELQEGPCNCKQLIPAPVGHCPT